MEVKSKTDGDIHYIGASKLAKLYGVKYSDCIVYNDEIVPSMTHQEWKQYIHLFPKRDGRYNVDLETAKPGDEF
jgi:hypothetical protein